MKNILAILFLLPSAALAMDDAAYQQWYRCLRQSFMSLPGDDRTSNPQGFSSLGGGAFASVSVRTNSLTMNRIVTVHTYTASGIRQTTLEIGSSPMNYGIVVGEGEDSRVALRFSRGRNENNGSFSMVRFPGDRSPASYGSQQGSGEIVRGGGADGAMMNRVRAQLRNIQDEFAREEARISSEVETRIASTRGAARQRAERRRDRELLTKKAALRDSFHTMYDSIASACGNIQDPAVQQGVNFIRNLVPTNVSSGSDNNTRAGSRTRSGARTAH